MGQPLSRHGSQSRISCVKPSWKLSDQHIWIEIDEQDTICLPLYPCIQRIHDVRRAVADMKEVSPHSVLVSYGSAVLGNDELVSHWVRKGRLRATVHQNVVSFFTASSDNTAKQHDAFTGECVVTYTHSEKVTCVCLSDCGCFVYTASDDGHCRKFDEKSPGQLLKTYSGCAAPAVQVSVSPGSEFVYAGISGNIVRKFNEKTCQLISVFEDHVVGNPSLVVSPCGRFIFKANVTCLTAKKYNWQNGDVVATYNTQNPEVGVTCIALVADNNDASYVYVGCTDGSVMMFSESGDCLSCYWGAHTDRVNWLVCR